MAFHSSLALAMVTKRSCLVAGACAARSLRRHRDARSNVSTLAVLATDCASLLQNRRDNLLLRENWSSDVTRGEDTMFMVAKIGIMSPIPRRVKSRSSLTTIAPPWERSRLGSTAPGGYWRSLP